MQNVMEKKKIKSRGTSERKKEKLIPGCKLEEKKKEKSLQYSFQTSDWANAASVALPRVEPFQAQPQPLINPTLNIARKPKRNST